MKKIVFKNIMMFIAGVIFLLWGMLHPAVTQAADYQQKKWTAGGAIGFIANTPDGTAFALNLDGGIFLNNKLSVGPLLQVALNGDLEQIGLSGQGKFWIPIPNTSNKAKVTLQGGLGFVHADRFGSDTSFLIPIGIGLDYRLHEDVAVYTDFLLNFTDLDTERGNGDDTNIMPGLTFGARF